METGKKEERVYLKSREYAELLGQLDQWHESRCRNIACADAIAKTILHAYDGMYLRGQFVRNVVAQFGVERVQYVLANTVRCSMYDGRYSPSNKKWASAVEIPPDRADGYDRNLEFAVRAHPAILDGYINEFRTFCREEVLFSEEHCFPRETLDLTGKVFVVRADELQESMRIPENQLWLAIGGFGCRPEARGHAVYGICLADGEKARWENYQIAGALKPEYLPEWAAQALEALQRPQEKPSEEQQMSP